jgi:hypothetical protein
MIYPVWDMVFYRESAKLEQFNVKSRHAGADLECSETEIYFQFLPLGSQIKNSKQTNSLLSRLMINEE